VGQDQPEDQERQPVDDPPGALAEPPPRVDPRDDRHEQVQADLPHARERDRHLPEGVVDVPVAEEGERV
jgi:hypothetical protein